MERADFKEPETVEEVVEVDRKAKELAREVARRWL
jgi:1-deoxy-D-xylulose-5-phosphate reductoisomerase